MPQINQLQGVHPIAQPQEPKSLTENTTVMKRLKETFPEMTESEMKDFIKKGEALEKVLVKASNTDNQSEKLELLINQVSAEKAVALMWLLTAKTAHSGQQYTSGAMRIENGKIISDYLKLFSHVELNGGPILYNRISTHLEENLGQQGTFNGQEFRADSLQWGLDLKGLGLPANKHSVLFALQPDGSIYIKMEERGYPPAWKKGYRTWNNIKEDIGHWGTFITTRFQKSSGAAKRKEHVPERVKVEYEHTMKLLYPPKKQSFFSKLLFGKREISKEGEVLLERGLKFGASKMNAIVKSRIEDLNRSTTDALKYDGVKIGDKVYDKIDHKFFNEKRRWKDSEILTTFRDPKSIPKDYHAGFKGEEALIPALGVDLGEPT